MQTSSKDYVIGILLIVCILMAFSDRWSPRRDSTPDSAAIGRYQIVSAGNAMNPFMYFLDTKTGQCWMAGTPADSLHKEGWQKVEIPGLPNGR